MATDSIPPSSALAVQTIQVPTVDVLTDQDHWAPLCLKQRALPDAYETHGKSVRE